MPSLSSGKCSVMSGSDLSSTRDICICTGFLRSISMRPGFFIAMPIALGSMTAGTCGASCCAAVVSSLISASILVASMIIAGAAFAKGAVAIMAVMLNDNIIDLIGMFFIVFPLY